MEKTGQDLKMNGDTIMVTLPEAAYKELEEINIETERLNEEDPDIVPREKTEKDSFEMEYVQTSRPVTIVNKGRGVSDFKKGDQVFLRAFVAVSRITLSDVNYFVVRPADILATL